jgi:hypothetical protein
MSDPNVPGFNPGGIKDRADNRDFLFEEVGFGTAPFDWNVGFDIEVALNMTLPVKDQGSSFSCGGQAWSSYAGVLEAAATHTLEERSAKFFYAQTYQAGGGSTGRDNANVFINQGACYETFLPSYENSLPPSEGFITRGQDISAADRTNALTDKGFNYSQTGTDIDTIAQAIRDNHGVVIGVDGQNNGTWVTAFPTTQTTGWRHWVYGGKAKLINGKKFIGFLNSWGKGVGEQGWQWLSEDFFTHGHVWSGWTHTFNNTPPPPSFHHVFNATLVYGTSSVDIVALQTVLQLEGTFPLTVSATGFYGNVTATAVLAFRVKYGISSATDVQGHSVGPLTRVKLNQLYN